MTVSPEEMSASQARGDFAEVIRRAEHGETTYITHHGRRVAAMVPVEAAEALERLEERALLAMAREALAEPGQPVPLETVIAELGLDR
jgi:prevent-host-death family protein